MTLASGWYKDPYFLHHERYWDNGWTDLVRRVGVVQPAVATRHTPPSVATRNGPDDAGPSREAEAATLAAGLAALATRHRADEPTTGTSRVVHDDDTFSVAAIFRNDDTAAVAAVGSEADTQVVPAVSRSKGTVSTPPPSPPSPPPPWESGSASREEEAAVRARARHRRLGLVAAALVVVILLVVAVFLATGGGSGKGGNDQGHGGSANATADADADGSAAVGASSVASAATPSAAQSVTTVASTTLRRNSVVLSVALVPIASSQSTTEHISGSGEFLLDSGLGTFSATASSGTAQTQKFVFQGHTLYVNVSNSPVPGKSWVVATTDDLPALGPGSSLSNFMEEMGNPGMLVQQLTSTPLTASSLGRSSINGTPVHRYEVTFSVNSSGASSASLGPNTSEEVDVGTDRLVQQIVIPVRVSGQSVQGNIVVSFSHYGKSITVDSPPFSQLITLSQYLTGPVTPSA